MSEMIERVARGLRFVMYGVPPDRELAEDSPWLIYAKTAIQGMREPIVAMIEAEPEGDGEFDKTNSAACAKAFWQAMIDAALNPLSPATDTEGK